MTIPAGTRLGPYEIIAPLGAGGMGEVYKARDPRLARDVALKVLAPDRALDKDALARFAREAKTASALNHPHIVNIYEIGEAETTAGAVHYIAMELVEGQTLRERLRSGTRWRSVVEPLVQVADALAKAHKAGIVHRDLKPENVMITPDGYPKVLDFGLAKLMESADSLSVSESDPTGSFDGQTRAGTILGTPGYMSPEQVQGKPVDHRSDIFSFGCMLYEVATGRRPFKGDSQVATLHAIVYDEPPAVESLNAEAPPELRRIVRRCLAKDPEHRYQAIKDVANDLRELARGETTPKLDSLPTLAREMEPAGAWSSARRLLIASAVAAVIVAGVVAGLRSRRQVAEPARRAPAAAIKVEKLTSRGNANFPAISPDGRYLAYTSSVDGGPALLLRDLAERTETRLAAERKIEAIQRIRFAKNSQAVYVTNIEGLYRVPLIGGEARLVHSGSSVLSPDDSRVAFERTQDGKRLLFVADVEGGQEKEVAELGRGSFGWFPDGSRLLVSRPIAGKQAVSVVSLDGGVERKAAELPERAGCHWWKPGAESVLCRFPKNERDAQLVLLDLAGGAATPIGDRTWRQINGLHWLPDGNSFVVNEVVGRDGNGIYLVSYPDGKAERVPADAHSYWNLGMTADGTKLVSVQSATRADIVVSSDGRDAFKKIVSGTGTGYRLSWTADGKLVYSSNEAGSYDLYVVNGDGANRKQLTFDRNSDEIEPTASPDGRYIVFVSNRTGEAGLYRMNRDGTDVKALTPRPVPHHADRDPHFASDSQSVLFRHRDNGSTLWRVPIDGGTPVLVKGARPAPPGGPIEHAYGGSASPDGRSLAFLYMQYDPSAVTSPVEIVVAAPDGRIAKRFPYLEVHGGMIADDQRVQWSADGTALYYNLFKGGDRALWKRPLAGGPPVQVTHFEEPIDYFDWSFNGKMLAVSRSSSLSDVVLISNFR